MMARNWAFERIKTAEQKKEPELDLSSMGMTELPEEIGRLTNLQSLNLGDNDLERLPESMAQLTNLQSLDLSYNNLRPLPDWLSQLTNLQHLVLNGIQLETLPEWLTQLTNLQYLNLYQTKLRTLPRWLGQLTSLQHLNLSENNLRTLPEEIGRLTNLRQLHLNQNKLETLPEWLAQLTNLQHLTLTSINLKVLPGWLSQLTDLQNLVIGDNSLNTLPEWLVNLPKLEHLVIFNNPITEPSPEILGNALKNWYDEVDLNAVRRYYAQLREEGEEKFYEAKLLIVGEGGVGKTSLARKLEDPDRPLAADEESTAGIEVIVWNFDLPVDYEAKQYRVNIWDFGGQAIYFATHQFFLTKRSVYVIVADTRRAHTDFYEWLRMQEAFGGDSPVILVKNRNREVGNRFYIENLSQIQERFPNLKRIFEVDLNAVPEEKEWPWLVETLREYFLGLEHVGRPRPKTWVKVREALYRDARDTISREQFIHLCYEQGVKREADALQLSDYLHHLGELIHFQNDPVLDNIVILNPTWGMDAVYRVLDNSAVIDNWGQFSRSDLSNLWHESKYASHHHELLRLMRNFQLCFPLPGQDDDFIAPQLLSPDAPAYDWQAEDNLQLRYKYPVFMPRGILSRAIVKLHDRIEERRLVWRSGVILKSRYARAELLELRGEREIRLRISGRLKRELLVEIVRALDELHRGFPKLTYHKQVPCKCSTCTGQKEPHFFALDQLRSMLSHGVGVIQCQKPNFEMVPIHSLIDDTLIDGRPGMSKEEIVRIIIEGDFILGDKIGGDKIGGDKREAN